MKHRLCHEACDALPSLKRLLFSRTTGEWHIPFRSDDAVNSNTSASEWVLEWRVLGVWQLSMDDTAILWLSTPKNLYTLWLKQRQISRMPDTLPRSVSCMRPQWLSRHVLWVVNCSSSYALIRREQQRWWFLHTPCLCSSIANKHRISRTEIHPQKFTPSSPHVAYAVASRFCFNHRICLHGHVYQVLGAKALELRNALIETLVLKAREQNNDIISQYESMLTKIGETPTDEADLAALRNFIVASKEKVRKLRSML